MTTLIEQYSTHQHVLGYSRRTIGQRAWSLGLWHRFLEARDSDRRHSRPSQTSTGSWTAGPPPVPLLVRSDIHQFYKWAQRRRPARL